jgi:hypothetical protein
VQAHNWIAQLEDDVSKTAIDKVSEVINIMVYLLYYLDCPTLQPTFVAVQVIISTWIILF